MLWQQNWGASLKDLAPVGAIMNSSAQEDGTMMGLGVRIRAQFMGPIIAVEVVSLHSVPVYAEMSEFRLLVRGVLNCDKWLQMKIHKSCIGSAVPACRPPLMTFIMGTGLTQLRQV